MCAVSGSGPLDLGFLFPSAACWITTFVLCNVIPVPRRVVAPPTFLPEGWGHHKYTASDMTHTHETHMYTPFGSTIADRLP